MSDQQQQRQRQARQRQPRRQHTEYLEEITAPGVDATSLPPPVSNLLADDYPLANIKRSDREYFRLLSENVSIYTRELFPPSESAMQGLIGAALYEDPSYQMRSLPEQTRVEIETALMDSFARSSRGLDGWQQDKLGESIKTNRVEDNRQPDSAGVLGGLFQ